MANEHLGLVEEGQRRASFFARFIGRPDRVPWKSHTIDVDLKTGTIERREGAPEPMVDAMLAEENAQLRRENARLRHIVTLGRDAPEELAQDPGPTATIPEVMQAFCDAMNAAGETMHGAGWTLDHLKSQRRSRAYAWPRHICVYLVRQICVRDSFPKIGHAFGGRDHTTAMHACRYAPRILADDRRLAAVHATVLAAFGMAQ